MNEKILIASDHAGFEYKEKVREYLKSQGYECFDLGTYSNESVDYPVFANKLCDELLKTDNAKGILICGTGIGMSIAANRHKGVRACVCWSEETARLAREHNDCNVLCLGARFLDYELVLEMIKIYLETDFLGGKHKRRIDYLDN